MEKPFDVVVVGGGITGAGIARDAALRGLKVALFEKGDFGSGTSSKSSKLIHGGLRYLKQGELGLVFESVSERRVQSRVAPHLVRPLPFLVPIYEGADVGLEMVNIGLWIYDTLALFRSPRHRTYRGRKALELEPELRPEKLRGAIEYHDCYTDDARLVLENIVDARDAGAECRSYTEVVEIERDRLRQMVSAVRIRDVLTGGEETVPTRTLILAAGPWINELCRRFDIPTQAPLLRPTKGVHLVFPREKLPLGRAVTLIAPSDRRVLFAIPWRQRTILGTTDTDFAGSADEVHADAEDARYLCESANAYFPQAHFRPEEAIASWAGLRPLINEETRRASDVSREHQVYAGDDGVVIVAGGKLTTYRLMAKEVVRATVRWLRDHRGEVLEGRPLRRPRTKKRPLPGAAGLSGPGQKGIARLVAELAADHALGPELAEHLGRTYGMRAHRLAELVSKTPELAEPMQPDLQHVWAEVEFAVESDLARTVDDVLSRRVPLLLVGREQGLDVAERVADRMASRLGWTAERRAAELDRYRRTVADSRRFRSD